MKNKILSIIAVVLFPFAVISFSFRSGETNFILDENECTDMGEKIVYTGTNGDVKVEVNAGLDEVPDETSTPELSMRVFKSGKVETIPLEEYIIGVVAGEMPASFHIEALKAQAVASRTYALYRRKSANGTYDVTSDTRTQMHITEAEMRKKWGSEFDKYYNKIKSAVEGTKGQVITYKGDLIEAFYSAMSSGATANSGAVFNENRAYLQSVASVYDNASIKGFEVTKTMSKDEFKRRLAISCTNPVIDYTKYTNEGYLESISVCSKVFTGWGFRNVLGLKSSHIKIQIGDTVSLTTRGDGHCVGLSQYGSNGYASAGYTYEDIIKHYYTDVEITNLKNV